MESPLACHSSKHLDSLLPLISPPSFSTFCPFYTQDASLVWPLLSSSPPSFSVIPARRFSAPNTTPSKMLPLSQIKAQVPALNHRPYVYRSQMSVGPQVSAKYSLKIPYRGPPA